METKNDLIKTSPELAVLQKGAKLLDEWLQAAPDKFDDAFGALVEGWQKDRDAERWEYLLASKRCGDYRIQLFLCLEVNQSWQFLLDLAFYSEEPKGLRITIDGYSLPDRFYQAYQKELISDLRKSRISRHGRELGSTAPLVWRETGLPFQLPFYETRPRENKRSPMLRPTIRLDFQIRPEEILAQLCLWAIREKFFVNPDVLWDYLCSCVRQSIRSETVKQTRGDDIASGVRNYLLQGWREPVSARSWSVFIGKAIGREIRKVSQTDSLDESKDRSGRRSWSQASKNLSIAQVTRATGISSQAIYWAIYDKKIKPEVQWTPRSYDTPGNLIVTKRYRRYRLTPANVQELKELKELREEETKLRKSILELLCEKKDITPRAAQRWIKRRLDRGQDLKEIGLEALNKIK